ncbi:MAG: hypothetical protein AB8G11_26235 [Saprospiraceae bacterium]
MANVRSKVFQIAHSTRNEYDNWSHALKAAWKITKMQSGHTTMVEFTKDNGEKRTAEVLAVGSLKTLEKGFLRYVEETTNGTQWRTFRLDRLNLE